MLKYCLITCVFMLMLNACQKESTLFVQADYFKVTEDSKNFVIINGVKYTHMNIKENTKHYSWKQAYQILELGWWNKKPYTPCEVFISYAGSTKAHLKVRVETDSFIYDGSTQYIDINHWGNLIIYDSAKLYKNTLDSSVFFYASGQCSH